MKVLAGLALFLCLTGCAVGQIIQECVGSLSSQVSQLPSECQSELPSLIQLYASVSTMGVTQDALDTFCASSCIQQISALFEQVCDFPLIRIVCAQDDEGYCSTTSGMARIQAQLNATANACVGTDCTNAACNTAYQSYTCCVSTSFEADRLSNVTIPIPEGCMLPDVCAGGMAVFAMPAVLLVSLLVALLALL